MPLPLSPIRLVISSLQATQIPSIAVAGTMLCDEQVLVAKVPALAAMLPPAVQPKKSGPYVNKSGTIMLLAYHADPATL